MRTSSTVPKTVVRIWCSDGGESRVPRRLAVRVAKQPPHLHCRDAANALGGGAAGPRGLWPAAGIRSGGEEVGGRWRMPARPPAARTQPTQVSYQQRNRLLSPYSYGNITVRTMSRIPVPKSGIRPVERNASLQRHTQ